uniref:Uncharacterized protein n=1 Tax=Rhizophora mucronata TaxID=61149 RepID=A0A2P2PH57_RHIMU
MIPQRCSRMITSNY